MALPVREQLKYLGIAAAVLVVVLWFMGDILLPFVLGAALAYLLDPIADRLEKLRLSRAASTAIITIATLFIFALVTLLVIPTLVRQTANLIETAPLLLKRLVEFLTLKFPSLLDEGSTLRNSLDALENMITERGGQLLEGALASAASLLNLLLLFVIVPVVTVYLLLDWDRMVAIIDGLLPRDLAPTIRQLSKEIDATLSSFIRGMGTVCLILGTYYSVALIMVGLQFGLVVGAIAGIVTFIPYLGAMIGGALAIGLALFQFWGDWVSIGLVAAIFASGQMIEGNILTPKLVGNSVGLHPVWLLLALSVFGALFGFVGMLVAVPIAAAIGVIARFAVDQYLGSALYMGTGTTLDEDPD